MAEHLYQIKPMAELEIALNKGYITKSSKGTDVYQWVVHRNISAYEFIVMQEIIKLDAGINSIVKGNPIYFRITDSDNNVYIVDTDDVIHFNSTGKVLEISSSGENN